MGDDASYRALHTYVNKHYPKKGICEECEQIKPTDYALIHGRKYSRNREDYWELCRVCHTTYDRKKDHGEPPMMTGNDISRLFEPKPRPVTKTLVVAADSVLYAIHANLILNDDQVTELGSMLADRLNEKQRDALRDLLI